MLNTKSSLNIAIIGAGPGGLTLALCLSNHVNIKITIFEKDKDHRIKSPYKPSRSYSVDITGHGSKVIHYLKMNEKFDQCLLKFKGVIAGIPFTTSLVKVPYENGDGWTGSRGDICKVLLEELLERNHNVNILFKTKATVLDINEGKLQYEDNADHKIIEEQFDFIVAADGAGSEVRDLMEKSAYITVDRSDVKASCRMIEFDQNTNDLYPNYLYVISSPPHPAIVGAINGPLGSDTTINIYIYIYIFNLK